MRYLLVSPALASSGVFSLPLHQLLCLPILLDLLLVHVLHHAISIQVHALPLLLAQQIATWQKSITSHVEDKASDA